MDKYQTIISLLDTVLSGSNVFYGEKPNGNNRCIVVNLVSAVPFRTHNKSTSEFDRFQIDCYEEDFDDSITLGNSVKNTFEFNNTDFKISYLTNHFNIKDIESGLYRDFNEFVIW